MAVSKRLRYEVLRRDDNTCRYCGASAPDVPLRVDHVMPVALGGTDDPTNLVTACEPCNSGKTSSAPDAALVAGVSDDALRWAAAMQQAAEALKAKTAPKLAYRAHFKESWDEWTWETDGKKKTFELPDGWKTSLDNFREAGLPEDVWPDIVEKAMTNKLVRSDNTFRYCCGIGWRMVSELQEVAKTLVSPGSASVKSSLNVLGQVAVDVWARNWTSDHNEAPAAAERSDFTRSVAEFQARDKTLAPERLIAAAASAGCDGSLDFSESLTAFLAQERADIVMEWADAWSDLGGGGTWLRGLPDSFLYSVVQGQVDELDGAGVSLDRISRAAVLAGFHHSSELHHGLRETELEHTGVTSYRHMAADLWSRSFHSTANRWPTVEERGAFMDQIDEVAADSNFYVNDLMVAAVAAGSYMDPDLTTCLPRHLSALEVAALPLGAAA
jgi:hypothetical protein